MPFSERESKIKFYINTSDDETEERNKRRAMKDERKSISPIRHLKKIYTMIHTENVIVVVVFDFCKRVCEEEIKKIKKRENFQGVEKFKN